MRVIVKSHNPNDPDRLENKVKVIGYTKHGLSTQDMLIWLDWFRGPGFYYNKSIAFTFYGPIETSAAFTFLLNWLRSKDPDLILKHTIDNPNLCYDCVHGLDHCPLLHTDIPTVIDGQVKQCDMLFLNSETDGG